VLLLLLLLLLVLLLLLLLLLSPGVPGPVQEAHHLQGAIRERGPRSEWLHYACILLVLTALLQRHLIELQGAQRG
jgi:hypothetical protein